MTVNGIIDLFEEIAEKHHQINDFGFGNLFELDGEIKPGLSHPVLWVVPLETVITKQTKQRRFLLLVAGLVKADMSNRDQVWSDTESILHDVVKVLEQESDDYDLINEPVFTPVTEEHGDWLTGWQTEVVIETERNSNYCDIPMDDLSERTRPVPYVVIRDKVTGEVVTQLVYGQEYEVVVASGIDEGGASTTYSIQVVDI